MSASKLKSQLRQAEREMKRAEREAKKAERELKKLIRNILRNLQLLLLRGHGIRILWNFYLIVGMLRMYILVNGGK